VRFYTQAIHGQLQMLHRALPIPQVLAEDKTTPEVKTKLRLVQELSIFAKSHLGLPAEKQFQSYCDLGRPYAVWVVYAAPEFSTKAKGWWYPVVGTLHYRGFFDAESAKTEALKIKKAGFDVYVGGVAAYSTLGWFKDPVLNTFMKRTDVELAELIFHELTHARVFIPGGTDYNEALATATAEESVRRWLRAKGQLAELAKYETGLLKDREIIHLILRTRDRLKKEYARPALSDEQRRSVKTETFVAMRREYETIKSKWHQDSRYDQWFAKPMNNARLNTIATYYDMVPHFEKVLKECGYDLEAYFKRVASEAPPERAKAEQ
jgi:predicted aminopeptidase